MRLLLHYGFIIAILVIRLGFGTELVKLRQARAPAILDRLAAVSVLQKNRGNIERCIAKIDSDHNFPTILLDFIFTRLLDAGISVDITLGSMEHWDGRYGHPIMCGNPFGPKASWKGIFSVFDSHEAIATTAKWEPRCYRIDEGDSKGGEEYWVGFLERLSVKHPDENGCVISALESDLKGYALTAAFVHRYVTDKGTQLLPLDKR